MKCAHLLICIIIACPIMSLPPGDMTIVTFMLYTRANPETPEYITEIANSTFNKHLETIIIIHGFKNNYASRVVTVLRKAYLKSNDFNVIVVDWSEYSMKVYSTAVEHTENVSFVITFFIEELNMFGAALSKINLVGYSLGAHIAGGVGKYLQSEISYIIGLDPSAPIPTHVLQATDAQFVQVIHTNGGIFGISTSIGTADYFPNGGKRQPNCNDFGICSHSRSYELFAESLVNPTRFVSVSCGSFEEFQNGDCAGNNISYFGGAPIDFTATGNYFLYTNEKSPFAINGSNINYKTLA